MQITVLIKEKDFQMHWAGYEPVSLSIMRHILKKTGPSMAPTTPVDSLRLLLEINCIKI